MAWHRQQLLPGCSAPPRVSCPRNSVSWRARAASSTPIQPSRTRCRPPWSELGLGRACAAAEPGARHSSQPGGRSHSHARAAAAGPDDAGGTRPQQLSCRQARKTPMATAGEEAACETVCGRTPRQRREQPMWTHLSAALQLLSLRLLSLPHTQAVQCWQQLAHTGRPCRRSRGQLARTGRSPCLRSRGQPGRPARAGVCVVGCRCRYCCANGAGTRAEHASLRTLRPHRCSRPPWGRAVPRSSA